jgi:hypothetical protein
MEKPTRLAGVVFLIGLASALFLTGCKSKECNQMLRCCHAIEGKKGVGQACGGAATNVDDPNTCLTILESVKYMWENREEELPKACRLDE